VFVAEPPLHKPLAFDPAVLGSIEAVVDVVEVRRAIEGEVAALAAQRASAGQVQAMRQALAAIDAAAAAGRDGVAEDLAFHRAIAEATGNPQFSALLGFLEQYLREATRVTRGNEARHAEFMAAVRSEHQAIVAAIAAGDAAAARRAAVHHMKRAAQRLVEGGVVRPQGTSPRAAPPRATAARRASAAAAAHRTGK
jgi:GntR family transcriptional repressor for pyruvate dehydrogenase complex